MIGIYTIMRRRYLASNKDSDMCPFIFFSIYKDIFVPDNRFPCYSRCSYPAGSDTQAFQEAFCATEMQIHCYKKNITSIG
jgi:hypothetical protein